MATLADILFSPDSSLSSSAEANEYLAHLTNSPLSKLVSEPPSLTTHAHHLTASLTNLTHTSYPTFIALHKATSALATSLDSLSISLSALLTSSLPALETSASNFRSSTEPILQERAKARGVLEQHDKLRDLLDVPILIDTCVRNGYYAEALSLAAHVSSSTTSTTEQLAIMRDIRYEVDQSVRSMLGILLETLREPGRKLPALWKAASFIRRMEVLEEDELALVFLTARAECLEQALETLTRDSAVSALVNSGQVGGETEKERDDVSRFLRKYIDTWREGVYDIITQYTAIFLEERAPMSSASIQSPRSSAATSSQDALRTLLSTYTSHTLNTQLLPTLTTYLSRVPAAYASLLTQLTYCATAFARVGMDFRGLLSGIFSDAVSQGVQNEIRDASKTWNAKVQGAKSSGKSKSATAPTQWLTAPSLISLPRTLSVQSGSPAHIPPPILASYPPLAEFTNALLTTFNGLRLLAPNSILQDLLEVLDTMLSDASENFLGYARDSIRESGEKEMKAMHSAGEVFVQVFLPFVRRALIEGVYGLKMDSMGTESSRLGQVRKEWEVWLEGEA